MEEINNKFDDEIPPSTKNSVENSISDLEKNKNSINDLTKFNNIENKIYKIEQDMKKKDQKKILTIQIIIK